MDKTLQTMLISLLIGVILVFFGMIFYFSVYSDEFVEEELADLHNNSNSTEDDNSNDNQISSKDNKTAQSVVSKISWQRKTIDNLFRFFGFKTDKEYSQKEGNMLFHTTKTLVLLAVLTFGSVFLTMAIVSYLRDLRRGKV